MQEQLFRNSSMARNSSVMPQISVIIPTYNRASFLIEAIESVVKQSFKNKEILIIDDGSTDNTSEIVGPYVKSGVARYFWQENKGVSAARNKGIIESRGKFIAFLDSDDLWTSEHLAQLNQALEEFDEAHCAFSSFKFIGESADSEYHNDAFNRSVERLLKKAFSEQENRTWLSNDNLLRTLFQFGFPFRIQGSMVSREFVANHGLRFDEAISYTEEAQFFTEAALYTRFLYVDKMGLLVRRHSENVGDQCYQGKIIASYEQRIKRMKERFRGKLRGAERRAFNYALWQMGEYIMIERGRNGGTFSRIGEAIRLLKSFSNYRSFKSVVKLFLQ